MSDTATIRFHVPKPRYPIQGTSIGNRCVIVLGGFDSTVVSKKAHVRVNEGKTVYATLYFHS